MRNTPYDKPLWTVAVMVSTGAVMCVPIFSHWEGMSHISQGMALLAVTLAAATIPYRLPRLHPAVIAYALLVAFWGFSYAPEQWDGYFSLLKLTVFAIAMHVVVRTPRHVLVLLGGYALAGVVTLVLNWATILDLRYAMSTGAVRGEYLRLEGTFANANLAGIYAASASISGLIVFFNTRSPIRWCVLTLGLGAGLLIGGLSGSRTGLLGLLITSVIVPFMAVAGRSTNIVGKLCTASIFVALALGIAIVTLVQFPQFERFARLKDGAYADRSTETRWAMAQATIAVWKDYPIAGAGFGGFRKVSEFSGMPAHTAYGEVLADAGLIGFMLFLVWYLLPFMHMLRIMQTCKDSYVRRFIAGLIAFWVVFVVMSAFSHLHVSKDLVPIWAGICGAIQQLRLQSAGSQGWRGMALPQGRVFQADP